MINLTNTNAKMFVEFKPVKLRLNIDLVSYLTSVGKLDNNNNNNNQKGEKKDYNKWIHQWFQTYGLNQKKKVLYKIFFNKISHPQT